MTDHCVGQNSVLFDLHLVSGGKFLIVTSQKSVSGGNSHNS